MSPKQGQFKLSSRLAIQNVGCMFIFVGLLLALWLETFSDSEGQGGMVGSNCRLKQNACKNASHKPFEGQRFTGC